MKATKLLFAFSCMCMLASCGEPSIPEGQQIANEIAAVAGLAVNNATGKPLTQGETAVNKSKGSTNYIIVYAKYSKQTSFGIKSATIEWSFSKPEAVKSTLMDEATGKTKVAPVSYPKSPDPDLNLLFHATIKYDDGSTVYTAPAVYNVTFVAKEAPTIL